MNNLLLKINISDEIHKDTAMMIHFEDAFVADGTMMCPWWFWFDTFFAYAHSFWNQATLRWITRWHGYTHIIMEADISQ